MKRGAPAQHGSTFGGNPVACAAALATLDLVEGSLTENAATVGELLVTRLRELQRRQPQLTDVRGRGLMIGIDFPNHDTAARGRAGLLPRAACSCSPAASVASGSRRRSTHPTDQAETAVSILADACAEVAP